MSVPPPAPLPPPGRPTTPVTAWQALEDGNARFVHGLRADADTGRSHLADLARDQRPFALVLGCSDSRVPAEIVFDQGPGDLVVVRTAGHVVDSAVLGSLEFGITVLGVPLVVVLGHEGCDAVEATVQALADGTVPVGYVRDLVERITPSVLTARRSGVTTVEGVEVEHVRHTTRLLAERSVVLSDAVASRRCAVVGTTYELTTGRARLVDAYGEVGTLTRTEAP
jgi:carbonic anhydrase